MKEVIQKINHCELCAYRGNEWASTGIVGCCKSGCICHIENNIEEKFASMEHERWAKWQNYLHSFLKWNEDNYGWLLPHEQKDRWQTQIQTPYSMLSEQEKQSDREQVKPYLEYTKQALQSQLDTFMSCIGEEPTIDYYHREDRETSEYVMGNMSGYNDYRTELLQNLKNKGYEIH